MATETMRRFNLCPAVCVRFGLFVPNNPELGRSRKVIPIGIILCLSLLCLMSNWMDRKSVITTGHVTVGHPVLVYHGTGSQPPESPLHTGPSGPFAKALISAQLWIHSGSGQSNRTALPAITDQIVSCSHGNSECARFRKLLSGWPQDKPKAAFYFLTQPSRLAKLKTALKLVDKNFNNKFKYPVIIFHEKNLLSHVASIRKATWSDVYFQEVSFSVPDFLPRPVEKDIVCHSKLSYRHMCRFHARGVYEQPILHGLDYYWRLDDDSEILSDVTYDVFKFMRDRKLTYGYRSLANDTFVCLTDLWNGTRYYVTENHLSPQFFNDWKEPLVFYSNFEISALHIWLSEQYAQYIEYIDRLGGIFDHRWGDAPIKSLALSVFVPKNNIYKFEDIKYRHD